MRSSGVWILVAALACALAIAACSGANKSASGPDPFLKFAVCMRSHGVPNFPDPAPGGGIHLSPSLNPLSPAFQSAQVSCKKLLPGGGPPPVSEAQKRQALAFAQCMRTHGVPSFPDPTFPAGGGILQGGPNSGVNPNSPAFGRAAKACGGPGGRVNAPAP